MRPHQVVALTFVLLAAACTPEVVAPSARPSASTAPPAEGIHDALYVREARRDANPRYIARIDASTGAVLGALADGVVSADRTTLFRAESMDAGTHTRVHEVDLLSGAERRIFTVGGNFAVSTINDRSPSGRWLLLSGAASRIGDEVRTEFAVLNADSGVIIGGPAFVNSAAAWYFVEAIAPDGSSLLVRQTESGGARLRLWDLASAAFLGDGAFGGWDGRYRGNATPFLASPDGVRLYWLDAAGGDDPRVRVLDFTSHRVTELQLPSAQRSAVVQENWLWSLALSSNGTRLYAINRGIAFVNEIDAPTMTLRHARQIALNRTSDETRLAGALLSPDGETLYAAGTAGVAVIDAETLALKKVWASGLALHSFTLTADGARLYAINERTGEIVAFRTRDGLELPAFRPAFDPNTLIRVDPENTLAALPPASPAPCGAYAPPDPTVPAEIQHLKTEATVIEVTSACTVRVRIAGGSGSLYPFVGRVLILRATSATAFASAQQGDLGAIASFGLRSGETFTLSFDSRAFSDGSYPLNSMNR
jgi:DNA-binding beta-propeller fold protein YncE